MTGGVEEGVRGMGKYVCIDVGGTFTDAAVLDESGDINVFKAPTTPHDYLEGMLEAVNRAADFYNEPLDKFLLSASVASGGALTHGSTIATNAVLEKKVGKVGMIVTKGFRDVLLFRDGPIKNPFDFQLDFPEPYVPRYLTLPVNERITAEGDIDVALDDGEVKDILAQFKKWDVDTIAVCLIWSVANPVHEQRIRKIVQAEDPEMEVILSSEVNPCIREYRRWVSAAMDASLKRLIATYCRRVNRRMNEAGFQGEVGMLNSTGGVGTADELIARPLYAIDSGPALAPVAGSRLTDEELAEKNAVVLDMGGTTFDVSCVRDGVCAVSREATIGWEVPGISRVDVHSIGAGGGSIAWVDAGKMVRVGPHSAGSQPGPACYDRGGIQATVSDANLLLGYLDPDYFNDGKMNLRLDKAEQAIRSDVAGPLDLSLEEAAFTIWTTVNANMVTAIKDITISQGIDPRDFVMVVGGGACGAHAIPLAEGLEMSKILIPKTAGALSAVGGVFSEATSEFSGSVYTETRQFDFASVNAMLAHLFAEAEGFFQRNGIAADKRAVEVWMEGRYTYQVWEIPVRVDGFLTADNQLDEQGLKKMVAAFHVEHEKAFAVEEKTAYVECVFWRLRALGKREMEQRDSSAQTEPVAAPIAEAVKGVRKAYFREAGGMIDTPLYLGLLLEYGNSIEGPAVIVEPTTTIAIQPGYRAEVTMYGNYLVHRLNGYNHGSGSA
jgi:N-methylhydantoinase A